MPRIRALAGRRYPVGVEMTLIALVLAAWQLTRIPLEGDVGTSVAHARSVLRLERFVGIAVEPALIDFGSRPDVHGVLLWIYGDLHIPLLLAFLSTACLLAPDRYPRLRTTFVVSFLPAAAIIGLYPLAPPRWMTELGLGPAPTQDAVTSTFKTLAENSTAAAASQHFGFAIFIAAASLWLAPHSGLARATVAYPALVFVVIVGTANHYVFDCVVGALTFALGAVCAAVIHGRSTAGPAGRLTADQLIRVAGFTMLAWAVESLEATDLGNGGALAARLTAVACAVVAVWRPTALLPARHRPGWPRQDARGSS